MDWEKWATWGIVIVILFGVALVLIFAASAVLAFLGRRSGWPKTLSTHARWPFRWTLLLLALMGSTAAMPIPVGTRGAVLHGLTIVVIITGSWLLAELLLFFLDLGAERRLLELSDTFEARKIRTQLQVVRRLVIVVMVIIAIGAILMTFPAVRAVGASVLASAGIASVVAGLAAQSLLGNLFAGVQLAFNEAIRVGDVVVVNGEYGRIEEITLSYVVLKIWDQRTLVLPCTYFTSTPFENWTKLGTPLLGTIELDLDWRVPLPELRAELDRVLGESDLWDGVSSGVQVTEATGGLLRVRVVVSASDASGLWDLRCLVREQLAEWVRRAAPEGLPVQRVRMLDTPGQ